MTDCNIPSSSKQQTSMLITPKPSTPDNKQLIAELEQRGYDVKCFNPKKMEYKSTDLREFERELEKLHPKRALLRGFGRENTQKVFFRLHLLKVLEEYGIQLMNSSKGLEMSSNKFFTSLLLEKHKIPTPKTTVCQTPGKALEAFEKLNRDVILKPLIGSKGIGISRLNERGFAERVIYSLSKLHEVYYLQEFIAHYKRDIRILVVGNKAIVGMYRVSDKWKTNLYAGAHLHLNRIS
ncbi:MAG: RimK family alpha-L-glutamate ligase [Promethearchaeia archaeon]